MPSPATRDHPDALLVGGGVIGLLTARALLQKGQRVLLLERGEPARQSSWAGGGILSPLAPWRTDPSEAARAQLAAGASAAWKAICAELEAETGLPTGFGEAGMLLLAPPQQPVRDWLAASGEAHLWLDGKAMLDLLGPLAPPLSPLAITEQEQAPPLLLPERATLRPPRACAALLAWLLQQPGFELRTGVRVQALSSSGGRIEALHSSDGSSWSAANYVVTAGAWSSLLLPFAPGVAPVRGQMIAFETRRPLPPLSIVGTQESGYAVLRADGLVLVGSTLERAGFNAATTAAGKSRLCALAARLLPALAGRQPDHHWAGLRPGASRPLIGALPGWQNLWLSTGHYRDGFSCAPASATLLAALMNGEQPELDAETFRPSACS